MRVEHIEDKNNDTNSLKTYRDATSSSKSHLNASVISFSLRWKERRTRTHRTFPIDAFDVFVGATVRPLLAIRSVHAIHSGSAIKVVAEITNSIVSGWPIKVVRRRPKSNRSESFGVVVSTCTSLVFSSLLFEARRTC